MLQKGAHTKCHIIIGTKAKIFPWGKVASDNWWWRRRARQELPGRKIKFSSSRRRRSQNFEPQFSGATNFDLTYMPLPSTQDQLFWNSVFHVKFKWVSGCKVANTKNTKLGKFKFWKLELAFELSVLQHPVFLSFSFLLQI